MTISLALMMLTAAPALAGGPEVKWTAPGLFVSGQPYNVKIEITAPKDGTVVSGWMISPSAFTVDGKALGKREDANVLTLPPGFVLTGSVDLEHVLPKSGDFQLGYASEVVDTKPVAVKAVEGAAAGLDFMTLPEEELSKHLVLLQTNRGDILVRVWPHVALEHARNFLDLAATKFYDGTTFHRVMPGFMIQGGDPTGTGSGDGKRKLKPEFNAAVKHLKGVLSMARGGAPDSASCQFFIMHGAAPNLDGSYSAFGEAVFGMDVVDRIANAPGTPIPQVGGNRPTQAQKIERALVVKIPSWIDPNPSQDKNGPINKLPTPAGK
jgi:cyclophilin family peptidyl-prolyl cis-trans isomerase